VERSVWTDERIDERMAAIDITFGRIDKNLDVLRDEMQGLRQDMWAIQRQLSQIGWGLTGALVAAMVALIVALV
jgi:DNA anti-recombination protein RmuC